jgi:protein SCO1/2
MGLHFYVTLRAKFTVMAANSGKKTGIFLLAFFIVLAAVFMGYYYKSTREQPVSLPVMGNPGHKVGSFSFVNQDGKTITDKDVAGKIRVAEYFFCTCKTICPKLNENLNKVYEAYKGNDDVMFLSHTVDPEHDSIPALKEYSRRFDADSKQWEFLTGSKQELYNMARYEYLISAQDDTSGVPISQDFIHDNHYALVDRDGRIRGFYDGLKQEDVDKLIADIGTLLKEK